MEEIAKSFSGKIKGSFIEAYIQEKKYFDLLTQLESIENGHINSLADHISDYMVNKVYEDQHKLKEINHKAYKG